MRKNNLTLLVLLILCTFLFSCKKNNDTSPAKVTSTWTFDGKTYSVTGAAVVNYDVLTANDDVGAVGGGNYIKITFGSVTRPSASVTLTVVDLSATSNPSNCVIQVGNIYDATRPFSYLSTGKAGDKVFVTVASSGKVTATFSNISVSDSRTTKTVSGTIAEE